MTATIVEQPIAALRIDLGKGEGVLLEVGACPALEVLPGRRRVEIGHQVGTDQEGTLVVAASQVGTAHALQCICPLFG